eukprot:Tamp_24794.p2 GENE.Tamp_24794~~Tamp_24794.p2  ORF type:complete len:141 (+),score=6.41 Tamp_24794:105-527(+)
MADPSTIIKNATNAADARMAMMYPLVRVRHRRPSRPRAGGVRRLASAALALASAPRPPCRPPCRPPMAANRPACAAAVASCGAREHVCGCVRACDAAGRHAQQPAVSELGAARAPEALRSLHLVWLPRAGDAPGNSLKRT